MALNPRQCEFVNQYLIDFNGTRAAIRAGYSVAAAPQAAYSLLTNSQVMQAIEDRRDELAAAAGLSVQWVLRQWKQIAEADPNELIYTKVECCRHCHGENHLYQWTEFEYGQAVIKARDHDCGKNCEQPCHKGFIPPLGGGLNFDPNEPPVENCPVCHGDGVQRVVLADTRRLRGSARRLYAGVKQTQHGIEVKMRDQDTALKNIAQYLGMLVEKREVSAPGGGPVQLEMVDARDLTDEQLIQVIQQGQLKAPETIEAVRE